MQSAVRKSDIDFIQKAKVVKRETKKRRINEQPEFIVAYEKYLLMMNYSISTIKPHLTRTKNLQKFFSNLNNINIKSSDDFKFIKPIDTETYEKHLIYRIGKKEIKDETAYSCLKNLRLFLQFLNHKKIIDFTYTIPKKFVVKPTRLNTCIDQELVLELVLESIADNSYKGIRTSAILLLLIDTGCRPVEVSNLKINDINLTEKTIIFYTVKSDKRTLTLSDLVIKACKTYIKIRDSFATDSSHLFLNETGEPIPSSTISSDITALNKKAFGKCLINARAIRHTYITNAIENKNEIKDVAASVGHKHQESTMYYLYRSKKRLLANTLKFDPLNKFMEE